MRGIITFPEFTPNDDWYTYVFHVTKFSGEVTECSEGTLKWVPYQDVKDLPTWKGDRIFLEWILEDRPFFSAKFIYKEMELLDYSVVFY